MSNKAQLEVYLCLSIVKRRLLNNNGWGDLYAAYPCIENMASFLTSVGKSSF